MSDTRKHGNEGAGLPLRSPLPRATRIRPVVVYGVAIVLAGMLAFALIRGLAKAPTASARAVASPTPIVPAGELPETVRAVPGDYGKLAAISQALATPDPTPEPSLEAAAQMPTTHKIRPRAMSIEREVRRAQKAQDLEAAWNATSRFEIDWSQMGGPSERRAMRPREAPSNLVPLPPRSGRLSRTLTSRAELSSSRTNLENSIISPVSPYLLQAGTLIPIAFVTGVNSDLPGTLLAQVAENVYDTVSGRHLLVPQGTRVIGRYDHQIAYAQDRVLIVWERLIFPDGSSLRLDEMPGVDTSGYAGASDRVNFHTGRLVAGVVLGSLIGAGADELTAAPGFGGRVLGNAGNGFRDASRQITERNLNRQPTIEIRPGTRANVFVVRDITLKPYEQKEH